eukprot:TRINITY_DN321_c0_g2_i1.p1 TRINITY_DN321_c0_g2~~TRINITY_DN321_c0_g2_i1.p1  ORF type:complete len:120 (+),score=27.39 TRINITY_DN321_c0_g2_i1:43-360(+)
MGKTKRTKTNNKQSNSSIKTKLKKPKRMNKKKTRQIVAKLTKELDAIDYRSLHLKKKSCEDELEAMLTFTKMGDKALDGIPTEELHKINSNTEATLKLIENFTFS